MSETADLIQDLSTDMLKPGAIFTIPVHYLPPYPYPLVVRGDSTGADGCIKIIVVSRWNDLEPLGYPNASKEREIVFQAKARPFLVLQRFERKIDRRVYGCVLGLPITSVTDEMRANREFMRKLRSRQAVTYYLLDPAEKPETRLRNQSMVVIPAPYVLPEEYFLHRKGYAAAEDFGAIRALFNQFICGSNHQPPTPGE